MPNFGRQTERPGGEPPPRRQLTPEEIHVRETFNRAEHLAGIKSQPASNAVPAETLIFDEPAIRATLAQQGLDFSYQIFPIGEKPTEATGRSANREARITELESERVIIRKRMTDAESITASAVRELNELKVSFATLQSELESMKSAPIQEAT